MDKETIFKEIRNRAIKDDTDLGDIIYDVLNRLYPNELKEYDLSVLDPRRGIMNPYDIIDVILKDASKEEEVEANKGFDQNEADDIDKQIEQKLKEIELLKQKKEELKDNDVLNFLKEKDIDFCRLSSAIYETGGFVDTFVLYEEAVNLLKSLKKYSAKQMSSEHFIASIENNQYKLKLVIDL